ncbi:PaaI family thioesterase [Vibrio sp. M60_M31a]
MRLAYKLRAIGWGIINPLVHLFRLLITAAGPTQFLNGGIISTVIDCHCICTAIAKGYQLQGREIGSGEAVWYATGKLEVNYLKPVPIDKDVELVAIVEEINGNKMTVNCELFSDGVLCCTAKVVAVQVPNSWFSGDKCK